MGKWDRGGGNSGRGGRGGGEARPGGAGSAKSSAEAVIAEAEKALEMGERKQRSRDRPRARQLLGASREQLLVAGLHTHRTGCLVFAAASTTLLEVVRDEARVAAFAAPLSASAAASAAADAAADARREAAVLGEVLAALTAGHAAAVAASASADELVHLNETASTASALLSEAHETLGDAAAALEHTRAAVAFLDEAQRWYRTAAERAVAATQGPCAVEPSVDLLRQLAPALMAHGRLALSGAAAAGAAAAAAALAAEGGAAVERALATAEEACALCDSERGDDLPAAVEEWARLLWEASGLPAAAEPAARAQLLDRAAAKAEEALALVGVPLGTTLCLRGDVLRAAADLIGAPLLVAARAAAQPPPPSLEATADADAAARAAALYARAATDGYGAALGVSRADLCAQLGCADAALDCARLLLVAPTGGGGAAGDGRALAPGDWRGWQDWQPDSRGWPEWPGWPDAQRCLALAVRGYTALAGRPGADWAHAGLELADLSAARFNCACARALAGDEAGAREALGALVAEGRLERADELDDADLAAYARAPWLCALKQTLAARAPAR